MEKNDLIVLNEFIYHLYDETDFTTLRRRIVKDIKRLIPCSYASILLADPDSATPIYRDPVCDPEDFSALENEYIQLSGADHTIWSAEAGRPSVLRESSLLTDEKRLSTPIYRLCYSKRDIYDTLQSNIIYEGKCLGVMTLYRTRAEGAFTDEDVLLMDMIHTHLRRIFKKATDSQNTDQESQRVKKLAIQYLLSTRETEILGLLLTGKPDSEITEQLSISTGTLKKHMQHIYRKMGISSRWELLRFTVQNS
ncbi:MAG: LuxR C-terminal-related transcriptional regulator [Eubacteriales bacterium]|jgi:DNA-binding CsgD family transcriptional regulator